MTSAERLLDLLPEIFRTRDGAMAAEIAARLGFDPPALDGTPEGPLHSLLTVLALQFDMLEAEVDNLYDDLFIETCADWLIPYIGELLGERVIDTGDPVAMRRQVAGAIDARRSKGTARALAERARDLMTEASEAIEYHDHLVVSLNLNFPRDNRAMSAALNGEAGRLRDLPHVIGQHTAELRDMREGGRFAVPHIGVRCWTLRSRMHRETTPLAAPDGGAGHFRFSPTGADIALWRRETAAPDGAVRLEAAQIPGPIPLIDAVDTHRHAPPAPGDYARSYYGEERSLAIWIDDAPVPPEQVCFCNLADAPGGGWNLRAPVEDRDRIRIDPVRGRFVLPNALIGAAAESIRVLYHYGSAFDAGGGGYANQATDLLTPAGPEDLVAIDRQASAADAAVAIADALSDLAAHPHVRLLDGRRAALPAATTLPDDRVMVFEAGADIWPTLRIGDEWQLTGGDGSELTIRGLRLLGGTLKVQTAGLRRLRLIDCTILPGASLAPDGSATEPARIVLDIRQDGLEVVCERCVLGRIALTGAARLDLADCLVDSAALGATAISAPSGGFGGVLSAARTTILGRVRLHEMDEVSECLFARRPGSTEPHAVTVERLQYGCVRYTGLPPGAIVPRRYRCYPDRASDTPAEPVFAALSPAEAAYGRLLPSSPDGILAGAEGAREMGVTNRTSWHRRRQLLARDLPDWTPFAMIAGEDIMD